MALGVGLKVTTVSGWQSDATFVQEPTMQRNVLETVDFSRDRG